MTTWKTCLQLKWTACETGKADFTPNTLSLAVSKVKASELTPRDKSHLGHLKLPELTHHATAEFRPVICVPMFCFTDVRLMLSILPTGARKFSLVHIYFDKFATQKTWLSSNFCSKNGCLSCMLHGRLNMLHSEFLWGIGTHAPQEIPQRTWRLQRDTVGTCKSATPSSLWFRCRTRCFNDTVCTNEMQDYAAHLHAYCVTA